MSTLKEMGYIKMAMSREQCRAARALLGWTQDQLAVASSVSKKTLADFEGGKREPYGRTLADVERALEAAGVEFIPENGGGAGVRLAKRGRDAELREHVEHEVKVQAKVDAERRNARARRGE